MFFIKTKMTAAIALTLLLAVAAFGNQEAHQTTPRPAPAAATAAQPKEPEYVEERGFKTKIIEVKYRDPQALYRAVRTLGSGFKGAAISADSGFKTMTIRDFPENISVIEEAIKRLDAPETPHPAVPDIEFHIHVLVASNAAAAADDFPSELNDVVKQLQSTLRYKSYSLMASSVHRASQEKAGVRNKGVAQSKLFNVSTPLDNPIFYEYSLFPLRVRSNPSGGSTIEIDAFNFNMRVPINMGGQAQPIQYDNVGFSSPVNLREGEKVVVGTTTMGDKGLIVVVTATLLKQ